VRAPPELTLLLIATWRVPILTEITQLNVSMTTPTDETLDDWGTGKEQTEEWKPESKEHQWEWVFI
jgi:hypothetical protein